MIRTLSLLLFAGAAGAALPTVLQDDYSKLRERPISETFGKLGGIETTLGQAAAAAAEAVGGRAAEARFDVETRQIEVVCYTGDAAWTVLVDPAGQVASKTQEPRFVLPGDPVEGDWTETDSGLRYWDIREGTGEMPPRKESQVKVHYTGWTVDGKQFDSSVERGVPATFPLNGVIAGWTEGVGSMKVGGKRKLLIPYGLAYGERGRPPVIPAKALLIFDVELLEVVAQ